MDADDLARSASANLDREGPAASQVAAAAARVARLFHSRVDVSAERRILRGVNR
jgi:hypothetical protein